MRGEEDNRVGKHKKKVKCSPAAVAGPVVVAVFDFVSIQAGTADAARTGPRARLRGSTGYQARGSRL